MNTLAQKSPAVVIVNAYGRSNRGDAVLLEECVKDISKVFPGARLTVSLFEGAHRQGLSSNEVEYSERIGNASGALARPRSVCLLLVALVSAKLRWLHLDRLLPMMQRKTLLAIRSADIIVSAPGGYIHDTNFAYYIALFHIFLGSLLGKTVILAPQSIGPIRSKLSRMVASFVLRKVECVCARENYTRLFLIGIGVPERNLVAAGDSAFWSSDVETDEHTISRELSSLGIMQSDRILGMTVVGWNFPNHSSPDRAYRDYVEAMASTAADLARLLGLKPVIFNQVSDDIPTAKLVQGKCEEEIIVDEGIREPRLLRALIARSEMFIGTRFHSCIFSMVAGRPTIAVSYLPKTQHILEDLSLSDLFVSIDEVTRESLLKMALPVVNDLSSASSRVEKQVSLYKSARTRFSQVLESVRKDVGL